MDLMKIRKINFELRDKAREILTSMDKEDIIETALLLFDGNMNALRSFLFSSCSEDDRAVLYKIALSDINAGFSDYERPIDLSDWVDGYYHDCREDYEDSDYDFYQVSEVIQRTEKHASSFRNKGMFIEAFRIVFDAFLMVYDEEEGENDAVGRFAETAGVLWNEIFALSHRDDYESYEKLFSLYMEKNRELRSSMSMLVKTLSDAAIEGFNEVDQLEAMLSDTVSFINETSSSDLSELERLSSLFIRLSKKLRKDNSFILSVLEKLPAGMARVDEERVELYEKDGRWSDALDLIASMLKNGKNLDWGERGSLMRKEAELCLKSGDLKLYEEKVRGLVSGTAYDEETVKGFLSSGVEDARVKMLSFIEKSYYRMDILRIMDESSLMFYILEKEQVDHAFPLYHYPPLFRHFNYLRKEDPERTLNLYTALLDELEPSATTDKYRSQMAEFMKRLYDSYGSVGRAECLRLISIWQERHGRRKRFFATLHEAGVDR